MFRTVCAAALIYGLAFIGGAFAHDGRDCGLYEYRAEIERVIDGDTVVASVDLGFGIWIKGMVLRLSGIDAPEPRGPTKAEGVRSRNVLRDMIDGREVEICTEKDKDDSFGRYLATIWLEIEPGIGSIGWMKVNEEMVRVGAAQYAKR